ncbi:monovalent cation/H(+) antiporter subunit G [Aquamicrobium sp. LC103]|uniref:monovalent cation/H(+) antiporter subunit G n=1 Tax=Aquamicrobium sp. LC103 TaxID=1120658 RepID=UPI000699B93E|nr:monovalent cation/H(+) antiporter subunit G [Aquamicrobium sp. LC103]TKT82526.1 Na+/H+ antiporter subunit G [Aquamicrobium sp. LC103]
MTTAWLSAFFLVGGAAICLIASVGVLRLPDFFLRMHAATEAGVAGCGLVLIGVGFAYPSVDMWIKIAIAVVFLLLTTPIAGHLLARAGYVAGVPLWGGTVDDQLKGELRRGDFDLPAAMSATENAARPKGRRERRAVEKIVLALAEGPDANAAIHRAIEFADSHRAELLVLAIVDTRSLENVGPVPIGGNFYAARLRGALVEKARHALADAVQRFEQAANAAGLAFSIRMEEGDPASVIAAHQGPGSLVILGRGGWFDQGFGEKRIEPLPHLARHGVRPVVGVGGEGQTLRRITFIHDGSEQSDRTWEWLVTLDPWPEAALRLAADDRAGEGDLDRARAAARKSGKRFEEDASLSADGRIVESQIVIFGNEGHGGWLGRKKAASHAHLDQVPIIVFG